MNELELKEWLDKNKKPLLFNGKDTGEFIQNGNLAGMIAMYLLEKEGKPFYDYISNNGIKFKSPLKEFFKKEFEA